MRGADASGFMVDPRLFSSPRFLTLTTCDLGALLKLWAAAWSAGCRLPADDATLAAAAGMTPAAWSVSALKARLGEFFRADDGALVPSDLEAQYARRTEICGKRASAGRASGEARRTRAEHLLNTCSTPARQVFADSRPGGEKEPAAAKRARRKPPASVQLAEAGSDTAATTAGTQDCTASSLKVPPKVRCENVPPTPPIEREENTSQTSQGGCGGAAGKLDLFGNPCPPPEAKSPTGRSRQKPDRATVDAASDLIDVYVESVRSAWPRTRQAEKNVLTWLERGYSLDQLRQAVDNYAEYVNRLGKDNDFRKSPSNFFGVQDGYFKSFLTKRPERETSAQPARDVGRGVSRIHNPDIDYSRGVEPINLDSPPADVMAAIGRPVPPRPQGSQSNPFLDP